MVSRWLEVAFAISRLPVFLDQTHKTVRGPLVDAPAYELKYYLFALPQLRASVELLSQYLPVACPSPLLGISRRLPAGIYTRAVRLLASALI